MEKTDWNLNDIFENVNDFEKSFDKLYELIENVKQCKGKLGNGVDEVIKCYKSLEKALDLHEKLYAYAMLRYHQDMSNQESIKMFKKVENMTTVFSEAESFILPELSKLDDEKLEEYLKDDRMKEYEKNYKRCYKR